jgi:hypothetical protein
LIDAIIGMIDERTKNLGVKDRHEAAERQRGDSNPTRTFRLERKSERWKGFEAILSNGDITSTRHDNGYELLAFAPAEYPDFRLPGNLRGTSAGALRGDSRLSGSSERRFRGAASQQRPDIRAGDVSEIEDYPTMMGPAPRIRVQFGNRNTNGPRAVGIRRLGRS